MDAAVHPPAPVVYGSADGSSRLQGASIHSDLFVDLPNLNFQKGFLLRSVRPKTEATLATFAAVDILR